MKIIIDIIEHGTRGPIFIACLPSVSNGARQFIRFHRNLVKSYKQCFPAPF